jgi:hypothetical protein
MDLLLPVIVTVASVALLAWVFFRCDDFKAARKDGAVKLGQGRCDDEKEAYEGGGR